MRQSCVLPQAHPSLSKNTVISDLMEVSYKGVKFHIAKSSWEKLQLVLSPEEESVQDPAPAPPNQDKYRRTKDKALVILIVLELVLVRSCFSIPRKALSYGVQADNKVGARKELVDSGNSERGDTVVDSMNTDSHHRISTTNWYNPSPHACCKPATADDCVCAHMGISLST
ncbi:uncharacterized protein A4U43_C05F24930 [Asparagus officinalis]|uniref:Uncharacterized protein n=1 Tax=Asparagus officinalis TaxID=4686 RepID=A0A5P1EUG1_ASPOF|nr:uncharacterized protein A4U43_C05F24930 [Asparagus officinalis]